MGHDPFCSGKRERKGLSLPFHSPFVSPKCDSEIRPQCHRVTVTARSDLNVTRFAGLVLFFVSGICYNYRKWEKVLVEMSTAAYVYSRTTGTGCPYCSGRYAIPGETDLKTLRPDIAVDWDYKKNGDIIPDNWTVGSGKKVWWKCKNGHERLTQIYERVKSNGCPECRRKKVMKKEAYQRFIYERYRSIYISSGNM